MAARSPETLRALVRASPAAHRWWLTDGAYDPFPRHVRYLSKRLALTVSGDLKRLLVMEPPRHGKTELVVLAFIVWFLDLFPSKRVILASHTADFAQWLGGRVRDAIEEHPDQLSVHVARDSSAKGRWDTTVGGGMFSVGVGGTPVGRGGDLIVVDDPVAGPEDVASAENREATWLWWNEKIVTRRETEKAVFVVMHQRWHEDDLAGRIQARATVPWEIVSLPAIAKPGDVLGRAEGEALWPERWSIEALRETRSGSPPRTWAAQFQQEPVPAEGDMFKREWLDAARYDVTSDGRYLLPGGLTIGVEAMRRYQVVDLAASIKTEADRTVIGTLGIVPDGRALLLDVDAARREGPDIIPAMQRSLAKWSTPITHVEKVGFQLTLIQEARRRGLPVMELEADKDKVSRALPLTAAFQGARILLPKVASWLGLVESELLAFPRGDHDDTVDMLSYAERVRTSGLGGLPPAMVTARPSPEQERAFEGLRPVRRPSPFR